MRLATLAFAFLSTLVPLLADNLPADCKTDEKMLGNFGLKPFVIIRIRLPLPFRISSGKYFDTVVVSINGATARIKRYLGNHQIDVMDGLTIDSAEATLEKYCPGNILDQIIQNKSSQARTAIVPPPAGVAAQLVTFADFDGDGTDDAASVDGNVLTIDFLKADGSLRSSTTYAAPADSQYIIAADFNGDTRPDLVVSSQVTNPATGSAFIYFNTGGGVFQSGQPIDAGNSIIKAGPLAAGDFNGDGKLDLIYSTPTGFRRLQGNGNGTFQGSDGFNLAIQPYSLVTADFNGDGKLDVVALDRFSNTLALRYGTGNGSFGNTATSTAGPAVGDLRGNLAYSDFNHDGQLDLLIRYPANNMFSLLLGNSNGTFQAPKNYVAPGDNSSLAVLPLTDGQFFILLMDRVTQDLVLYTAPGDGTILAPAMGQLADTITAITTGDFDGDGDKDLLFTTANNQAVLQRNSGNGTFLTSQPFALPARPTGAAAADLNGDGRADAIISERTGSVKVLLGDASGTLVEATSIPGGTAPTSPRIADFNKDGKLDVAVIPELFSGGSGQISVLLGTGQGGFLAPATLSTNAGDLTGIATGDFNGDGNPDIVVTTTGGGFGPGNIALFRGKGDGAFLSPLLTPISSSYSLASGDFNGDGKLDLAVLGNGGITIYSGNGAGAWTAGTPIPVLASGTDLQTADLNRDGILDLINNACCGEVRTTYLLGYGNGTFAPEEAILAPADPAPLAIADFNGDNWPDIALGGINGFFSVQQVHFPSLIVVNSAAVKYRITPDSIASAYGPRLATAANPTGSTITVKDSAGVTRNAFIYYSSPGLVNFAVPAGTALGDSIVTVTAADNSTSSTTVKTQRVVPALYVLNSNNLVAANVLRVNASGTTVEDIFQVTNGAVVAKPINMGPATDQIFLVLYGTGLRAAGKAGTTVTIAGTSIAPDYAGLQGSYPGFDQVNIKLPRTLIGKGATTLILTAEGEAANTVTLTIQ